MYLLKNHNCWIKQGYKISISARFLGAYEKLSHSSTAVFRGIECGIVVLVMFEFKLKKMSHRAITCGLRRASGDTGSVRSFPFEMFSDIKCQKQFTREMKENKTNSVYRNVTLIYSIPIYFVLLNAPRVTQ